MSNKKRPNTLLNYNFSSKKICTDSGNLAQDSNTPATNTTTTATANDDSNLFLSSEPGFFNS